MLLLIGFLFMLFIFISVGMLSGVLPVQIIDLPSAVIVIVPLIFFLILSRSGNVIGRYIKMSFTKEYTYTGSELTNLSMAIRNTIKFILGTSGVGFVLGIIACLINLENKEYLGPNLAVSLIVVLYSIAICFFVFFPTQAWAENKLNILKGDA